MRAGLDLLVVDRWSGLERGLDGGGHHVDGLVQRLDSRVAVVGEVVALDGGVYAGRVFGARSTKVAAVATITLITNAVRAM